MRSRRVVAPSVAGSSGLAVGSGMRAFALVSQFATAVVVSRSLGVEAYGQFAIAFAITGILALVLGMELANQVARSDVGSGSRFWGAALVLGLASGVVLTVAALTVAPSLAVQQAMLALLPAAVSGPAFATLVGTAMLRHRAGLAAGLGNAVFVLKLPVVALVAILLDTPRPVHFAAIDSLLSLAMLAVAITALGAGTWSVRPSWPALREVLRGARSLLPAALGAALVARLDVAMLGFLRDAADVGAYQVAVRIGDMPLDLYAGALVVFLPTVSTLEDGKDLERYYRLVTESLGRSLVPLVAAFVVYGDVAIGLIFGVGFASTPLVYGIIGLGLFTHIATGPNGAVLVGRSRGRALVLLALWLIVGDISLNLVLIPLWGVLGAALATTLCYLVVNVAASRAAARHFEGLRFPVDVVQRLCLLFAGLIALLGGIRLVGRDGVVALLAASALTATVVAHGALYARRASRTWRGSDADAFVCEGP